MGAIKDISIKDMNVISRETIYRELYRIDVHAHINELKAKSKKG
jgi:hypothetical protein